MARSNFRKVESGRFPDVSQHLKEAHPIDTRPGEGKGHHRGRTMGDQKVNVWQIILE